MLKDKALMEAVKLEACPLCADPMMVRHCTLRHVEQGNCLIGALAWDVSFLPRWNTRTPANLPEADNQEALAGEGVER